MNKDYLGADIKKLGFGLMRLPMIGEEVDIEQTKKMVDTFMSKGFTYFDTAYVYIGTKSEVAMKEAIVDRYPRDSFQIASKLPIWMINDKADTRKLFEESCQRAGVDYWDFYLLHALNAERFETLEKYDVWEEAKALKAEGRIKHLGFSFHDSAEVLEENLAKHADDVEFVQLQINYIDWESENVQARKCYEICMKYNKPVIVMEPVKGGSLVTLPEVVTNKFKAVNPELSNPSWAVRYCASLDGIITVLSGMSNEEQLNDNVSYMENFQPLNEEEQKVIAEAVEEINKIPQIPCTKCKYCVEGCPMQINIPEIFTIANENKKFGDPNKPYNKGRYENLTKNGGLASACIQCGACESQCPQHIAIIDELQEIAKIYG